MISAKVIVPKTVLNNPAALSRAVENTLSGAALDVKADFGVVTQTWDDKPDFTIAAEIGKRTIGTDDDVFAYVDGGTKPHTIEANKARALVFQANFKAKTQPRVIASSPGSKGGPRVFRFVVHHPGTAPRQFAQTIADKWKVELPVIMQRAIDAEVSRGSG